MEGTSGPVPRITVVDDEPDVAAVIAYALERAGMKVEHLADGAEAVAAILADPPDLVVLDLMLPGLGGMEVLRRVRASSRVPVILVSGIADVAERVAGLELGADDYVTKPFSPRELAARVHSVLRRAMPEPSSPALDFGDLVIDAEAREVRLRGEVVPLTTREFDLLAFLASSPRRVFTRDRLLTQVWESSADWQDPATVTEHVRRIRLKIESDPQCPRWIATVRGVGYRFEP